MDVEGARKAMEFTQGPGVVWKNGADIPGCIIDGCGQFQYHGFGDGVYAVMDKKTGGTWFVEADSPEKALLCIPPEAWNRAGRRKGSWAVSRWFCTCCGHESKLKSPICPNCGADMG